MKGLNAYQKVIVDKSRICVPYIAGLFEAEGCIQSTNRASLQIVLAQKSSESLLTAIEEFLKLGGLVRNGVFAIYSHGAFTLLQLIEPYLTGTKREQAEAAIELFSYVNDQSEQARHMCDDLQTEIQLWKYY